VILALEQRLDGIDDRLLESIVGRLLDLEPTAGAVAAIGSHARGTATAESDLDVQAVTREPALQRYRTWFEERPRGRPLHVSAGAKSVGDWLAERERPSTWALGFPVVGEAVYLWAADDVRERLGDPPTIRHPAAPAQLEDFVEALTKVQRARRDGDAHGLRWHAQEAGRLAPGLIRRVNPEVQVRSRREALSAALELPNAPAGYAEDLAACLGLTAASGTGVADAALRLGLGLLAFVREHDPELDDQPGVGAALRDGTWERLLRG
jgi:phosphoribosyl-AMP cyclohydrolase